MIKMNFVEVLKKKELTKLTEPVTDSLVDSLKIQKMKRTNMKFENVLEDRLEKIVDTLKKKGLEYTPNVGACYSRYHNFERAAEIGQTTREKALMGMALKHFVSILDIVEGKEVPVEVLDEKIGDMINYLILLEGMLRSNDDEL